MSIDFRRQWMRLRNVFKRKATPAMNPPDKTKNDFQDKTTPSTPTSNKTVQTTGQGMMESCADIQESRSSKLTRINLCLLYCFGAIVGVVAPLAFRNRIYVEIIGYFSWVMLFVCLPLLVRNVWMSISAFPAIRLYDNGIELRDFREFGNIPWSDIEEAYVELKQANEQKCGLLHIKMVDVKKYEKNMGLFNKIYKKIGIIESGIYVPLFFPRNGRNSGDNQL